MNIQEAKIQIENAVKTYLTKDEFGQYILPPERRRPVFLVGAPGIGKTAVMEQIAAELGVPLLSYAMTHHTRQSALGLPFIADKIYGGKVCRVSEYTMSEIIGAVHDCIAESGKEEGILFLDEINCVSETLSPVMLQFLQYKVFGRHRLPDGWIIVTAGNPPEYNDAVREFDVAMLDRVKRIDVEPDYEVWRTYAVNTGVHAAVLTYLDIKKDNFYKIENTPEGKNFATARGWCDLSDMLKLYERHGIPVDAALIVQYLQDKKIARDFAVYYELFCKYKSDYQVDKILCGKVDPAIMMRARRAKFDERLSLLGLLLAAVYERVDGVAEEENVQHELLPPLKAVRAGLLSGEGDVCDLLRGRSEELEVRMRASEKNASLSKKQARVCRKTAAFLASLSEELAKEPAAGDAFLRVKEAFDARAAEIRKSADEVGKILENVFVFCESAFGAGQEMLILVTELTANASAAHFIGRYGCPKYYEHNEGLLFHERQKELLREIEALDLED